MGIAVGFLLAALHKAGVEVAGAIAQTGLVSVVWARPTTHRTLHLKGRDSRGDLAARLTGTDAWSWDAPFVHTAKKYGQTKDARLIWEGHKAGRDIGYCHIEKLHNLESLPPTGFFISCFPHKIRGASAGWTRAVAIFDERLGG